MFRRSIAAVLSASLTASVGLVCTASAYAAPAAGPARGGVVAASGQFGEYTPYRQATTYDTQLVPAGSGAHVFGVAVPARETSVGLSVQGLVPEREYGAHVHTRPCGATGAAAGPHTQHVQAPADASHDPEFVNPRNEVWLDFTTGPTGAAFTLSHVDWRVGAHPANSVVIHERHTSTAPGLAGDAGGRVACIDVNF